MMYHWAPLPAFYIRFDGLKELNDRQPATDIAAMKIYILLAVKIRTHGTGNSISLTYDDFSEMAGLSRTLISRGLRRLLAFKLITISGGKKKSYNLTLHNNYRGWTKIPLTGLVDRKGNITIFASFRNRYDYELNALRIYLYLLFARSNNDTFTEVSYAMIYRRLGISYSKIDNALHFLKTCGLLLDRQITEASTRLFPLREDHLQAYRYTILGSETLKRGGHVNNDSGDLF